MHWFIKSIPYNYYGWIAAFIVPLVILGIVPIFGPMKKAEKRARETGVLAPPGSEKIDIRAGEVVEVPENPKVLNFFLPIFFLIGSTVYFDDMQLGVITKVAFMFFLYIPQGIMDPEEFADICIKGLKNMLFPLVMVVAAYSFASGAEQLDLWNMLSSLRTERNASDASDYDILVLGITEFIMGLSWESMLLHSKSLSLWP